VNREAELRAPSRVACSELLGGGSNTPIPKSVLECPETGEGNAGNDNRLPGSNWPTICNRSEKQAKACDLDRSYNNLSVGGEVSGRVLAECLFHNLNMPVTVLLCEYKRRLSRQCSFAAA
jgi:hypothetical protein